MDVIVIVSRARCDVPRSRCGGAAPRISGVELIEIRVGRHFSSPDYIRARVSPVRPRSRQTPHRRSQHAKVELARRTKSQIAARRVRGVGAASPACEIHEGPFCRTQAHHPNHHARCQRATKLVCKTRSFNGPLHSGPVAPPLLRLLREPAANLRDHHQLLCLGGVTGTVLRDHVQHLARILENDRNAVCERSGLHELHLHLIGFEFRCKLLGERVGQLFVWRRRSAATSDEANRDVCLRRK